MKFFYNLFVHLYPLLIRFAALWNPKAAQWVNGRKDQFSRLKEVVELSDKPIIWFHSASLGEFEQGRPVIETISMRYPSYRILLTFFSPSGFEVRKNYTGADLVFYLPMDTPEHARSFINITQPKLAIFVKYETWFNYLNILKQKNIPALLIAAVVYPHQFSFSPWSSFMKKTLALFNHIFAQSDDALDLLHAHDIQTNFSLGGDTRYDRVKNLSEQSFHHKGIESFINNQPAIVAGSTWQEDEKLLLELASVSNHIKLIIAPHEITDKKITLLKEEFPDAVLFSELDQMDKSENYRVLIIDCIGLLSKLYRYGTLTYVGGGFNRSGIHNILEPAVYGKIVLFGPNYAKSNEAKAMIEQSLAYAITNKSSLISKIHELLDDPITLQKKNEEAAAFVANHTGATEKILTHIEQNQLL